MTTTANDEKSTFEGTHSSAVVAAYSKIIKSASPSVQQRALKFLPVVRHTIERFRMYLPEHISFDDLKSIGIHAMMETLHRRQDENDEILTMLLKRRVRGAVLDELRRMDWASRGIRKKAREYQDTLQRLEQKLGRTPDDKEIRKELNLSPRDYHRLLASLRPVTFIDLDGHLQDESGSMTSWHDLIADDAQDRPGKDLEKEELIALLLDKVAALPQMQKQVLMLYYYEGLRLAEIAEVFGLTESRICQIHTQCILQLRSYLRWARLS